MNDAVRSSTIDDDLPFETDLAQLFQQSSFPRRLDIGQYLDRCEPRVRAGDGGDGGHSPRSRRYQAAAALGLGVCVLIGLWQMFVPPKSALAQVAAEMQRVASLRCTVTMSSVAGVLRGPRHGTLYWAASGSYREEQIANGKVVCVDICPANRPGISIFQSPFKTFHREPPRPHQSLPVAVLEKLPTLRGGADRELGAVDHWRDRGVGVRNWPPASQPGGRSRRQSTHLVQPNDDATRADRSRACQPVQRRAI